MHIVGFFLQELHMMHGHLNVNAAWLTLSSALARIIQGEVLYQGKQMILGFYLMTRQAVVGLGFLIVGASRSHSGIPNSVRLEMIC